MRNGKILTVFLGRLMMSLFAVPFFLTFDIGNARKT
jgi:hypothetical protein